MAAPTAQEVLAWQLINRARLDPAAEAALYGIDLNEGLAPGTLSSATRQPLAFNNTLFTIADAHSQSMIDFDYFAHNDPVIGTTPFTRMTNAGYTFSTAGENIAWQGTTGTVNASAYIVQQMQSLFVDTSVAGRSHRLNILNSSFQEVGVGQVVGQFTDTTRTWNASMVTVDFGSPSGASGQFLTGVVYNDTDANNFYSIGEGLGAVAVSFTGSAGLATETGGDYSAHVSSGSNLLTFSGAALPHPVQLMAAIVDGTNAEVDLQLSGGPTVIHTSTSVTSVSGVDSIKGLGAFGLTLVGSAGNQTIVGTKGNDTVMGGASDDTLDGGIGSDTASYADATGGGVTVSLALAGQQSVGGGLGLDTLISIENLVGSSFGDTLIGNSVANVLTGEHGNDTLVGHVSVFDVVSDTLIGGNGNDTIYGEASDIIHGGAGQDFLYIVNSNPININLCSTSIEWIQTDFGSDNIDASTQTLGVEVYSDGGNDAITGSGFNDFIWSGSGNDTVLGGGGDDVIVADIGVDSVDGGSDNDSLYVDANDTVIGGDGFDAVYVTGGTGMSLNLAASTIEWIADFVGGNDTFNGSGLSVRMEAFATGGNDKVTGGTGNDFLWGGSGSDTVSGDRGNDSLVGEAGADILTGGLGVDALYGNSGNGGDGAIDTFVFTSGWGTDFVFDFENGIDKFDMTALGTNFGALSITADGPGARVTLGSDMFIVANTAPGLLDAIDFFF